MTMNLENCETAYLADWELADGLISVTRNGKLVRMLDIKTNSNALQDWLLK